MSYEQVIKYKTAIVYNPGQRRFICDNTRDCDLCVFSYDDGCMCMMKYINQFLDELPEVRCHIKM